MCFTGDNRTKVQFSGFPIEADVVEIVSIARKHFDQDQTLRAEIQTSGKITL
jgi:hypothetical protein